MPIPDVIFLQWVGDSDEKPSPRCEIDSNDVTWSAHKIFKHDVRYVRAREKERCEVK
jgi:hypothetical protein